MCLHCKDWVLCKERVTVYAEYRKGNINTYVGRIQDLVMLEHVVRRVTAIPPRNKSISSQHFKIKMVI
jgi:hypothetical protein